MQSAKIGGLWTDHDDLILKEIDKHIGFLENEFHRQKFDIRRKKIKEQIEKSEKQKSEIELKVNYLKCQTAEYLANEIAIFDLMQRIVLKTNGLKFWNSESEFLFHKNHFTSFIYLIAQNILNNDIWKNADIRNVAKNPEWRMLWVLNRENLTSIFNKNLGELNINQKMLIYWSRIYDSAFESTNRPELDIIQDDEKFDNWLLDKEQEEKSSSNKNKTKDHMERGMVVDGEYCETCLCGALEKKGKGLGETPYHPLWCTYGKFRKYTEEEKAKIIEQIYGENSLKIRKYLNQETEKIEKAGQIEEHHLRGKKARELLGAKSKIIPIYKR